MFTVFILTALGGICINDKRWMCQGFLIIKPTGENLHIKDMSSMLKVTSRELAAWHLACCSSTDNSGQQITTVVKVLQLMEKP